MRNRSGSRPGRWKRWRITDAVMGLLVILLAVFILMIVYLNVFVLERFQASERERQQGILRSFADNLETNLVSDSSGLNDYIVNSSYTRALNTAQDHNAVVYALMDIRQSMDMYQKLCTGMDHVFFYAKAYGEEGIVTSIRNEYGADRRTRTDYVTTFVRQSEETGTIGAWSVQVLDGTAYIVYINKTADNYIGCWGSVDRVLDHFGDDADADTCYFLTDKEGVCLNGSYHYGEAIDLSAEEYTGTDNSRMMQVMVEGEVLPVYYGKHIAVGVAEANIIHVRDMMVLICAILLALLVLLAVLLEYRFHQPLRELVTYIMNAPEQLPSRLASAKAPGRAAGDSDAAEVVKIAGTAVDRRPRDASFREIQVIYDAFDQKMQEISRLHEEARQQEQKVSEVRLEYLQLQIRPHFVVNGLNSICAMIDMGRLDGARQMSVYLAQYLRSAYAQNAEMIPIAEELQHVDTYLNIQKLRYPGKLEYHCDVEEDCKDILVPPLMLRTFVENNVKYGVDPATRRTVISIHVYRESGYTVVVIRDTGKGFPEETLQAFSSHEAISQNQRVCVGITNVYARLRMLFGEEGTITLSNDHGAVVTLRFPAQT